MEFADSIDNIQFNLLNWFASNGRHFIPWKLRNDGSIPDQGEFLSPYEIWIAEVMLQQTQVKVVLSYWEKWMLSFPTLIHLVEADEHEVLMHWQGLGYYSRAKRIHQSAKLLIEHIGSDNIFDTSCWPIEIDQWIQLPGIGKSTAGSIISSAFDLPVPILDGNVKRILSRLIASQKTTDKNIKKLWEISKQLVPRKNPRNFNQALMDLGATVCSTRNPDCYLCPINNYCIAYTHYDPRNFPVRSPKKTKPKQEIGIGLVFNKFGELLIDQRLESATMGGMWEFPGGKKTSDETIEETIEREIQEELGIVVKAGERLLMFEHAYTHKKLFFTVHLCEWTSGVPQPLASQRVLWVAPDKLFNYPFPAANNKIISELHKHLGIRT